MLDIFEQQKRLSQCLLGYSLKQNVMFKLDTLKDMIEHFFLQEFRGSRLFHARLMEQATNEQVIALKELTDSIQNNCAFLLLTQLQVNKIGTILIITVLQTN